MSYVSQIVKIQVQVEQEIAELRQRIDSGNPFSDGFKKTTEKYNKLIDISQLLDKAEKLMEEVQFE